MGPPVNVLSEVHGNDSMSPGQGNSEQEIGQSGNSFIDICFTDVGPLGLKFTPEHGQAQVLEVIPGTQAEQHMQFRLGLMLAAVGGRDVSGMTYADVITLLKQVGRPIVLSFTHDSTPPVTAQIGLEPELGQIAPDDFADDAPNDLAGYYATPNYCDDSTSDDEIQAGTCHWHKRCREPCKMAASLSA
jgi:hypothetical protein